ncbi:MAG TPA: FTR1 family protein [Symbiobacteriaceae bacterium]|nr:FTR1 family protein [Symbiobacteriaceae bacterium]
MLYSFLITLREGLEAALIIGILAAYLVRVGRREGIRPVAAGVVLALVASLAGGLAVRMIIGGLKGAAMEVFEGGMMLLATAMLTYMIIWMQRQARHMKENLQGRLETALGSGSALALGTLAFTVVAREGLETVLFLAAGAGAAGSASAYVGGAVLGGVTAALLGLLLYRGTLRLNLRAFFTATGWLLIIFAAGMLANGFKELQEAGILPVVIGQVWDTYELLPDTTALGRMLGALLGYDAAPSLMQVAGYFGYLILAGAAFLAGNRSQRTA